MLLPLRGWSYLQRVSISHLFLLPHFVWVLDNSFFYFTNQRHHQDQVNYQIISLNLTLLFTLISLSDRVDELADKIQALNMDVKETIQALNMDVKEKIQALNMDVHSAKYPSKRGVTTYAQWVREMKSESQGQTQRQASEFQKLLENLRSKQPKWWPSRIVQRFPLLGALESSACQPYVSEMIESLSNNKKHVLLKDGKNYAARAHDFQPHNKIFDTFAAVSFNQRRPDIAIYQQNQRGACSITMLGDVKGRSSNRDFPDEEVGHILDMARELMMDHQFLREFIYCFLTDGYRFQFFNFQKDSRNDTFAYHPSPVYVGQEGWQVGFSLFLHEFDVALRYYLSSWSLTLEI
jgi:hypothetical protein